MFLRLSCWGALVLAGIVSASGQIAPGEVRLSGYASLPLRVTSDETFGRTWKVARAELRENLTATWGVLDILNTSKKPVEEARFYAEYYDSVGRLCLTLVFAGEENSEKNGRPIEAGGTRELLSLAAGLDPAVKPVEVRLRLVSQRVAGGSTEIVAGDRIVRSPVTLSSLQSTPLELNLNSSQRQSPIVDLLLARVTVNAHGRADKVEILNSSTDSIREWFEGLGRQYFRPASVDFVSTAGPGLFLVRAVNEAGLDPSTLLARESPWIKAYVSDFRENELPTVTQLAFVPSSQVIPFGPNAPPRPLQNQNPNLFKLVSFGSEWCADVIKFRLERRSDEWVAVRKWKTPDELSH